MKKQLQTTLKTCALSCVTLATLSGCMVGPNFKPLPPPTAKSYTRQSFIKNTAKASSNSNAGKAQKFVTGMSLTSDWWHIFHSKTINQLVQEGIDHNQTLVSAKAALRAANDTLHAEMGGLLLPSLDLKAGAQHNKINGSTLGIGIRPTTYDVFNTSFQASYLLDVWGASRREIEAYAAEVNYERYQMLGTYLTLGTNITTTAITIASLQAQIKTTQSLIQEQEKILQINKSQFAAGGISQENVFLQETQVAQTKAMLPPLYKSLSSEEHALAVLVGQQTNTFPTIKLSLNKLILPSRLPISLPSALITQRPDIQAAQALLHEASAKVGVATANLLPQINLTGNFGWQSSSLTRFFDNENQIWQMAAGVLQPLFHGGELLMQRKAAIAALDEARADYEQTVLQAFQNVSDALRAIQYDAQAFKAELFAEKSALKTLKMTKQQYLAGGKTYLSVLQAQQQYQEIVLSRIKAQAMRYTDTAALYQALGGGWWNNQMISRYGET